MPNFFATLPITPFSNSVVATDGSTSYGVGASLAKVTPELAEQVVGLSRSNRHYVVLQKPCLTGPVKQREGTRIELPLLPQDFHHVISARLQGNNRPERVELAAAFSALQHYARSAKTLAHATGQQSLARHRGQEPLPSPAPTS